MADSSHVFDDLNSQNVHALLGGAYLWAHRWLLARERIIGRERCWIRLRLVYWVAQVGNADPLDHRRVAKDGWRTGEVVKESNSGAKQNRRDVDVDFVQEAGIQELLDGVSAVNPNGLPGGGGFRLAHGAFDAVGHEVDSRVGVRPSVGDVVGKDERWSP